MKVHLEGTPEQILDALRTAGTPTNRRAKKGMSALARHQATMRATRSLLRAAFLLIRHDSSQQELVTALARALGGSAKVTDALIESAQRVVAEREKGAKG